MYNFLIFCAVLPVFLLCCFVYYKDKNKEPKGLLALIFFLGFVSVIPVLICELTFSHFFPLKSSNNDIMVFLDVFFGVAIIEEGFKWLITKYLGYNNKAFDEVFDIIVYSVFASLGFACFENIMYVLQNGFGNAVMRALLAIPGHTCFAISMGYYLSKAKVGQINGNHSIYVKNTILSMVVPVVLHTLYDGLLLTIDANTLLGFVIYFLPFYLAMVIVCFITVDKTAKVQQNLSVNIANGSIARNNQGVLYYNYQNPVQPNLPISNNINTVPVSTPNIILNNSTSVEPVIQKELLYCPICGKQAKGLNYCGRCGFKLK